MSLDWWTLGFQTVNVSVLIGMLGYFFWSPTAAIIEKRRVMARDMLASADQARNDAVAAADEIARTRAGFAHERETILIVAHAAATEASDALLKQAGREADAAVAAAKATVEASKAADTKAWGERSSRLAVEIAGRLAARLDGQAICVAFQGWMLKKIAALPDATRRAIMDDRTKLEAITAAPLEAAEEEHYRTLIWEAFQSRPPITFETDPSLIAGIELHSPHLIVTSSWKADLEQVLTALVHDDRR